MSNDSFHVAIIGGGIGGLCLAQGLSKAGVNVTVYEGDRTRTYRLQGYRMLRCQIRLAIVEPVPRVGQAT